MQLAIYWFFELGVHPWLVLFGAFFLLSVLVRTFVRFNCWISSHHYSWELVIVLVWFLCLIFVSHCQGTRHFELHPRQSCRCHFHWRILFHDACWLALFTFYSMDRLLELRLAVILQQRHRLPFRTVSVEEISFDKIAEASRCSPFLFLFVGGSWVGPVMVVAVFLYVGGAGTMGFETC